jgi:hypothetical protein
VDAKAISNDANAQSCFRITPPFEEAHAMRLEAIQVLLEHDADINLQLDLQRIDDETSLCGVLPRLLFPRGKTVIIV